MRPAARQRRRSDTRIAYGGEVSFQSLRYLRSDGTEMNSLVPFPKSRKRQCRLLAHRIDVRFGSQADICAAKSDVRLSSESRHVRCKQECPLRAGHCAPFPIVLPGCQFGERQTASGLFPRPSSATLVSGSVPCGQGDVDAFLLELLSNPFEPLIVRQGDWAGVGFTLQLTRRVLDVSFH